MQQNVVAFTGTRSGMTEAQQLMVLELLVELDAVSAHHGDCVGSDAEFHAICTDLAVPVTVHPPDNSKLRAWCEGRHIEREKPYLVRNKDIVRSSTVLIATPKENVEPKPGRGQGTWSTIRFGRTLVPVHVVFPNGKVNGKE